MGNMGYCRFRNTLEALRDCNEHLGDDVANEDEESAREALIKLCEDIANEMAK